MKKKKRSALKRIGAFIKSKILEVKLNLGIISREELINALLPERERMILRLPPEEREEIRDLVAVTDSLATVGDLPAFMQTGARLTKAFDRIAEKYGPEVLGEELHSKISYIGGVDSIGYRPSGAKIWKFFINPFQIFSFYAENHWATKAVIECFLQEVIYSGYTLQHSSSNDVAVLAAGHQQLKNYDIPKLRIKLLNHALVYGNALVRPRKNGLQQLKKYELLVMDRALPIYDKLIDKVTGWDYWTGFGHMAFKMGELHHLRLPSLKHPDLGLPPLSPLVQDLETDMGQSALNNNVIHKAGMIGVVIITNDPTNGRPMPGRNVDKFTKRLTREIQLQFSGAKGVHGILVSNYIQEVKNISKVGDFEGSFMKARIEYAKAVCVVYGLPPEKIFQSRSEKAQYQAVAMEDQSDGSLAKRIMYYMGFVDEFINAELLPPIGMNEFKMAANIRSTSLTLNAVRAARMASEIGPMFTKSQYYTMFFGLSAPDESDEMRNMYMDNSLNRNIKSTPPTFYGGDSTQSISVSGNDSRAQDQEDPEAEDESIADHAGDDEESNDDNTVTSEG